MATTTIDLDTELSAVNSILGESQEFIAKKFDYFKHIGIYIYSKATLMRLYNEESTQLEKAEGLEQLRALENGIKIKTYQTEETFIGVDIKEDIKKVENILKNRL